MKKNIKDRLGPKMSSSDRTVEEEIPSIHKSPSGSRPGPKSEIHVVASQGQRPCDSSVGIENQRRQEELSTGTFKIPKKSKNSLEKKDSHSNNSIKVSTRSALPPTGTSRVKQTPVATVTSVANSVAGTETVKATAPPVVSASTASSGLAPTAVPFFTPIPISSGEKEPQEEEEFPPPTATQEDYEEEIMNLRSYVHAIPNPSRIRPEKWRIWDYVAAVRDDRNILQKVVDAVMKIETREYEETQQVNEASHRDSFNRQKSAGQNPDIRQLHGFIWASRERMAYNLSGTHSWW